MTDSTRGGTGVGPAVIRICLLNGLIVVIGGAARLARTRRSAGSEVAVVDPRHHRAQLSALDLDLVAGLLGAHAVEALLAGAHLGDPLARELARLDLLEDVLHRLARLRADDASAARDVAVLGGVGD